MAKYKVIWFDDEYETLNIIREKAFLNGIELIGYNNAKAGIEELKRNIKTYDAAIIDGLFFLDPEQSGIPSSDKALFNVATALNNLNPIKVLPWFILSGQVSFTKEKNRYADGLKDNEVYDKLNEAHLEKLWQDIKVEADKGTETQIRHKYPIVFDVCTETYIGKEVAKSLLFLIEPIEKRDEKYNTEEKLNAVRKIIEKLFTAFNRIKVLPDGVWKGNGNINNSSKFLAGVHPSYVFHQEIVPPTIAFLLKNVLNITQDGSHCEGDLNLKIDYFIKGQPTGYLFNSVVFQLLEILVWFKTYFDTNKDFNKNSCIASLKPDELPKFIDGFIKQDKERNYHCEDVIITYKHFGEKGYTLGDKIKVLKFTENTNPKTMHLYSKSALTTERVDI